MSLLLDTRSANLVKTNFVTLNTLFAIDQDKRLFLVKDNEYVKTDIIVRDIKPCCTIYFVLSMGSNIRMLYSSGGLSPVLVQGVFTFNTFSYKDAYSRDDEPGIIYLDGHGLTMNRLTLRKPTTYDLPHPERIQDFECEMDRLSYEVKGLIYILDQEHQLFFGNKLIAHEVEKVFLFRVYDREDLNDLPHAHDRKELSNGTLWYITLTNKLYCYRPQSKSHHLIAESVQEAFVFGNRVCYLRKNGEMSCYCVTGDRHQLLFTQVKNMHCDRVFDSYHRNYHYLYVLVHGTHLYRAREAEEVKFELFFESPDPYQNIMYVKEKLFLLQPLSDTK